jgi:hypothetical protein
MQVGDTLRPAKNSDHAVGSSIIALARTRCKEGRRVGRGTRGVCTRASQQTTMNDAVTLTPEGAAMAGCARCRPMPARSQSLADVIRCSMLKVMHVLSGAGMRRGRLRQPSLEWAGKLEARRRNVCTYQHINRHRAY